MIVQAPHCPFGLKKSKPPISVLESPGVFASAMDELGLEPLVDGLLLVVEQSPKFVKAVLFGCAKTHLGDVELKNPLSHPIVESLHNFVTV
jgi:hypothetical protein